MKQIRKFFKKIKSNFKAKKTIAFFGFLALFSPLVFNMESQSVSAAGGPILEIFLYGDNPDVVAVDCAYSDPGGIAKQGGDYYPLTVESNNVDTSIKGNYKIEYKADTGEDVAYATREVIVNIDATAPVIESLEAYNKSGNIIEGSVASVLTEGEVKIKSLVSDDLSGIYIHEIKFTDNDWAEADTYIEACGSSSSCEVNICDKITCPLPIGTEIRYKVEAVDLSGNVNYGTDQFFNVVKTEVWAKSFIPSVQDEEDIAYSIQQTGDEGFIISGSTTSFKAGTDSDFFILKLKSSGEWAWAKTFGRVVYEEALYPATVHQTTDGGYIISGDAEITGGSTDFIVLKLDENGEKEWTRSFDGSGYDKAYYSQEILKSDGTGDGYIIAGTSDSASAGRRDLLVLRLNSDGILDTGDPNSWAKSYSDSTAGVIHSLQQTSDGGFMIVGSTEDLGAASATAKNFFVMKLDSSGNVLFAKSYEGAGEDVAFAIRQTADGGYIVVGSTTSAGAGGEDFLVLKLNSAGEKVWMKAYGESGDEGDKSSVWQTSDGGYIVAGSTNSYGNPPGDFLLLKLDSDGNEIWTKTYGGNGADLAYSVQMTSDEGYVVVGKSNISGNFNFVVLKMDSDGNMSGCDGLLDGRTIITKDLPGVTLADEIMGGTDVSSAIVKSDIAEPVVSRTVTENDLCPSSALTLGIRAEYEDGGLNLIPDGATILSSLTNSVIITSAAIGTAMPSYHKIFLAQDGVWKISPAANCLSLMDCSVDVCDSFACPLGTISNTTISYMSEIMDTDGNKYESLVKKFTAGTVAIPANTPPAPLIVSSPSSFEAYICNSTSLDSCGLTLENKSTDAEDCPAAYTSSCFASCLWTVTNTGDGSTLLSSSYCDQISLAPPGTPGNYAVVLTVVDQDGESSSTSQSLTLKQDIYADFECSADGGVSWYRCDDVANFNPVAGDTVDFRAVEANNLSTPSDPPSGTALSLFKWTLKDSTGAVVGGAVGNPLSYVYPFGLSNDSCTVDLNISDTAGRNAAISYTVNIEASLPAWKEVKP